MKRLINTLIIVLLTLATYGQSSWNYGTSKITTNPSSTTKVGIGTISPIDDLEISGDGKRLRISNSSQERRLDCGHANGYGGFMRLWDDNGEYKVFLTSYAVSYFNAGNVGIGTTSPDYKLDVVGTIRAHEIKVNLDEGADFVFEKDYNLMPLNELETFVKTKKHLPEVAPAKEMEAEGLSISEMNIKLLQKIEELTLYTIEQEKAINKLLENNQELTKRIEILETK